jgi:cyanamide hydratase
MSKYGFVAVPIDSEAHLNGKKHINPPTAQHVDSLAIPTSEVAKKIQEYAKEELPLPTYNHSMRVFLYGLAIARDQFPDWNISPEVYFATCLLHDIGATPKNIEATKLSFEFYGGIIARDLVLEVTDSDQDFADAVCEAIIRHQDLGTVGNITRLGFLLQLTTILDNVGKNTGLIHHDTILAVNAAYPRHDWLKCFAHVIDSEYAHKPWAHTTALGVEQFKGDVLSNQVKYD